MKLFDDMAPAAQQAYIRLLAEAPPEKKLAALSSLCVLATDAARSGLKSRAPEASQDELDVLLANLLLGEALASRVLSRRNGGKSD